MASWNSSYGDIGIKFRKANRHLHFVGGAKIRSQHTRLINEDGAVQLSLDSKSATSPLLNFRIGATVAADGGTPTPAGEIFASSTQFTFQHLNENGELIFSPGDAAAFRMNKFRFAPIVDNVMALGIGSARFTTVYATTGTINTSDRDQKTDIRDISDRERAVAVRVKALLKAYRFKDAVAEKDDDARIHFGVIAQDVRDAFAAEGLDGHRYALLCYDEWDEEPDTVQTDRYETKPAVYEQRVTTVEGRTPEGESDIREYSEDTDVVLEPAVIDERTRIVPGRKAGGRWGVRYDELFAFVLSAL